MKSVKLIPTILVKCILRIFYGLFCMLFKVDRQKVTFASYRSDTVKDNLAYVNKELARKYPAIKRHFLFKRFNSSSGGKLTYILHMIKACFHLATSRYFIIDDYYLPVYMIKLRKDVDVIQLWHSAGALKKFGLSTLDKPFGPSEAYLKHVSIHGNYTKAYVSSSEVVPFFAEAFGMPKEQILPLGVARTDYFYQEETIEKLRSDSYRDYPDLVGKKLLLYAPTFRGRSHYQDAFELPFDVHYMRERLQDEYVLMIHLHPYMQAGLLLEDQSFAKLIDHTYTIQELLALTDILITDYSTVFFDYSLLDRPMVFYPYDLEEYKQERDFYYPYEGLVPGPIVRDTESLVGAIKAAVFNKGPKQFKDRFFDYQDGRAAERIVVDIFKEKR